MREWFRDLPLRDKCLVLTIVDKNLVRLLTTMYRLNVEHGKVLLFSDLSKKDYDRLSRNGSNREKDGLTKYRLGFKEAGKFKNVNLSHRMREIQEAEDYIIQSVRITSINEEDDSITIYIDSLKNFKFFDEMVRKCQKDRFLNKEFQ